MPYFRTCPRCGAHLDPGEACDCRDGFGFIIELTPQERRELLSEWKKRKASCIHAVQSLMQEAI